MNPLYIFVVFAVLILVLPLSSFYPIYLLLGKLEYFSKQYNIVIAAVIVSGMVFILTSSYVVIALLFWTLKDELFPEKKKD